MGYLNPSTAIEYPSVNTVDMEYAELYDIYFQRVFNYLTNNQKYQTQIQSIETNYLNYASIPDMALLFMCFDNEDGKQIITLFGETAINEKTTSITTIYEEIDTNGEEISEISEIEKLAKRITICLLGYCKLYAFSIPAFFTTLTFATKNWTNLENSIFSTGTDSDGFLTKDFIRNYQLVKSGSNGGFNGYIYNNFLNYDIQVSNSDMSINIYAFTEAEQEKINHIKRDYGLLCEALVKIIIPGREISTTEIDENVIQEAADAEILNNLPSCLIEYLRYDCRFEFTPTLASTSKPLTEEEKQKQQDIYDKYESATDREFVVERENHKIYYVDSNGNKVFVVGDDT